jgi:hypothetical protein
VFWNTKKGGNAPKPEEIEPDEIELDTDAEPDNVTVPGQQTIDFDEGEV